MKPRICVCCGEPIAEMGNTLSPNPNLCASCSSLTDGMGEADTHASPRHEEEQFQASEKPAEVRKAA
jgi:hypothetical protein